MIGLGTFINSVSIIAGGLIGHFAGRLLKPDMQDALNKACGVSVLFIAIAGAIEENALISGQSMFVVLCLTVGTAIGELLGIERGFERLGEWLKYKSGNGRDPGFTDSFVTASLTVCIGAMAIVGAIRDGILGDCSMLAVKAVLDFIPIAVMTSSMGKGCVFSAIPVFIFEGAVTLLARLLAPFMTGTAIFYLSLIGSVLIFCIEVNLVWDKRIRVANMLLAVLAAYLPWIS